MQPRWMALGLAAGVGSLCGFLKAVRDARPRPSVALSGESVDEESLGDAWAARLGFEPHKRKPPSIKRVVHATLFAQELDRRGFGKAADRLRDHLKRTLQP